jgi:3-oxoacyl-[acyl-carrier-protein] synthase II
MSVSLLGIGAVSALGCGVDSLRAGLRGEAQPIVEQCAVATPTGAATLEVVRAELTELERFVPKRHLRRMDRLSRMALLAAYLAVEDSRLELSEPERVGLALGSGYGPLQTTFAFQDSILEHGDSCASPTHFANSVHNAVASQLSMTLGFAGPCCTVSCFGHSVASALQAAECWLREGLADYVLVGAGDEHCLVRNYAVAAGRQSNCGRSLDKFGTLGEGFVAFLLGRENEEAKYATLRDVQRLADAAQLPEALNGLSAVLLSTSDDVGVLPSFDALPIEAGKLRNHQALYGRLPTAAAFDAALAAIALKDETLYAPGNEAVVQSLPVGAQIGCLTQSSGNWSLLVLAS